MASDSQYATLGGSVQTGEIDADAVTIDKIGYLGSWVELGKETLTGAGTFSITGLTTTDYDIIIIVVHGKKNGDGGNNRTLNIQFNGDGGANYGHEWFDGTTSAGATSAGAGLVNAGNGVMMTAHVSNLASIRKVANFICYDLNDYGGGFYWNNTADKISRVDVTLSGAQNFQTGSTLTVYGVKTTV